MRSFIAALALAAFAGVTQQALATDLTVTMPASQQEAIQAVMDGQAAYKDCVNPLKCTSAKLARDKAVSKATKGGKIDGWFGTIKAMNTTHQGDAYLEIAAPLEGMTLATWNNEYSDRKARTLIKAGSSLYDRLSEMKVGQWVIFSGQISGEQSVSEAGSVASPTFTVQFSDVRAVTTADAATN
jgi:hypothetical protein